MTEKFDWVKDFKDFVESEEAAPPLPVTQAILSHVRRALTPSRARVFLKSALSAGLAGVVSLFFCPQFGVGFMRSSGLHHVFMNYLGNYGCSIACGAFFSAVGLLAAAFMLRPEELRVLRANKYLLLSALSSLSLAAFACLGAAVFAQGAVLWFIGAWLAGIVTTEGVSKLVLKPSYSCE